jgi:hypothetical protein
MSEELQMHLVVVVYRLCTMLVGLAMVFMG